MSSRLSPNSDSTTKQKPLVTLELPVILDGVHPLGSSTFDPQAPRALNGKSSPTLDPKRKQNALDPDDILKAPEKNAHTNPEELEVQPLMIAPTADWDREKETNDQSSESNEKDVASPQSELVKAGKTSTMDWKPLKTPVAMFIAGAAFACSHHVFNTSLDGKAVSSIIVSQDWVTRIGVGFSFGFQTAVGITMGFVLLQCLWHSILRKPLSLRALDTLYQVERQADLYINLPKALPYSPILVFFSIVSLLIPISGVFAPGSLIINTQNNTDVSGPCTTPSGNLSAANTPDSRSLFVSGGFGYWQTVTPRATKLTTQWFVNQRIPDLPQACGPNCRYKVSVPSFVFQCSPNPSSLPPGQAGVVLSNSNDVRSVALWNGTTDPTSEWAFYVAWSSRSNGNGTSGNAYCSPVQAQYDVEVRTKNGIQSVTTNITQTTSPIPDVTSSRFVGDNLSNGAKLNLWMQLASLSYATKALFLGSSVLQMGASSTTVSGNTQAIQASFLDIPVNSSILGDTEYVWGDVLKGIEEMSRNVTAAVLSLRLGTVDTECLFDQQVVVYKYDTFALWTPYATALGVALLSLVVAILIMTKNNTGKHTTSFSDTILLSKLLQEDISPATRLRFRAGKGNDRGFEPVWT